MFSKSTILGSLSIAALFAALPAIAQDKINLKFAHQFPVTNHLWAEGGSIFVDAVTEAMGDRIGFEVYPNAQLGRDNVTLMTSGVADIVTIVPSYAPEKVPLSAVAELPGLFTGSCEGSARINALARKDGLLDRIEYAPQGFRALFVVTTPPYQILTKGTPIRSLEDLGKMRIRAGGGALDATLRALGGVAVLLPGTELFDSIQRGTLDGAMFPYLGLASFGLDSLFKYSTEGASLGGASIIFAMREASWEKLSPEAQAAFGQAADKAQQNLCQWMDDKDASERERLAAAGLEVIQLSEAEVARWEERLTGVGEDWVARMDARYPDAAALLEAMRQPAAE